jgi:hypothetical protein
VSEREIAAEIVRAWRQGHVGSYVWQDTLDELERFIAAALAAAHAATERGPLVSCPWCGVRFADDCPASQQIRHLIECGDWLRAQVATLTAERDDYSRTAIDALAEVAALRAALEEERGLRVQLSDDSQRHLDRALAAEATDQAGVLRAIQLAEQVRQRLTEWRYRGGGRVCPACHQEPHTVDCVLVAVLGDVNAALAALQPGDGGKTSSEPGA